MQVAQLVSYVSQACRRPDLLPRTVPEAVFGSVRVAKLDSINALLVEDANPSDPDGPADYFLGDGARFVRLERYTLPQLPPGHELLAARLTGAGVLTLRKPVGCLQEGAALLFGAELAGAANPDAISVTVRWVSNPAYYLESGVTYFTQLAPPQPASHQQPSPAAAANTGQPVDTRFFGLPRYFRSIQFAASRFWNYVRNWQR